MALSGDYNEWLKSQLEGAQIRIEKRAEESATTQAYIPCYAREAWVVEKRAIESATAQAAEAREARNFKTAATVLPTCAIALLLLATFGQFPYGFYTLLRIVVCAAGAYLTLQTYETRSTSVRPWIMGAIALLFNPVVPIYLTRSIWWPIDFIVAIIFGISVLMNHWRPYRSSD